jgi:hypothetical protein
MNALQTEICRTKSEIESTEQQLADMVKDHTVPLWRLIETKRNLKELSAYLRGLQYQTSTDDSRINTKHEETRA